MIYFPILRKGGILKSSIKENAKIQTIYVHWTRHMINLFPSTDNSKLYFTKTFPLHLRSKILTWITKSFLTPWRKRQLTNYGKTMLFYISGVGRFEMQTLRNAAKKLNAIKFIPVTNIKLFYHFITNHLW